MRLCSSLIENLLFFFFFWWGHSTGGFRRGREQGIFALVLECFHWPKQVTWPWKGRCEKLRRDPVHESSSRVLLLSQHILLEWHNFQFLITLITLPRTCPRFFQWPFVNLVLSREHTFPSLCDFISAEARRPVGLPCFGFVFWQLTFLLVFLTIILYLGLMISIIYVF